MKLFLCASLNHQLDLVQFGCSFVPANPKRTDVNKSKSSATYYQKADTSFCTRSTPLVNDAVRHTTTEQEQQQQYLYLVTAVQQLTYKCFHFLQLTPFHNVIGGTEIDSEWHLEFHIFEQLYSIKSLVSIANSARAGLESLMPYKRPYIYVSLKSDRSTSKCVNNYAEEDERAKVY